MGRARGPVAGVGCASSGSTGTGGGDMEDDGSGTARDLDGELERELVAPFTKAADDVCACQDYACAGERRAEVDEAKADLQVKTKLTGLTPSQKAQDAIRAETERARACHDKLRPASDEPE